MTGFQPHPGTGIKITGEPGTQVPIESIVLGAGIKEDHLWIVNPHDLEEITKAIEEAVNTKGPRVLISRYPCCLYDRSIRKDPVKIDSDKCNNCMICIKNFGCPALTLEDKKVSIVEN